MKYVGLDVGTGFVKCFSEEKKSYFPSLFSVGKTYEWNKDTRITALGYEAAKQAGNFGVAVMMPVVSGRPVKRNEYIKLAKKALDDVGAGKDAVVCAGLPYAAKDQKNTIESILRELEISKFWIIPQAYGTAISESKDTCIVINIGHGTTEYLVIDDKRITFGKSDDKAANFLISDIDHTGASYTDPKLFESNKAKRSISELAEYIENQYRKITLRAKKEYSVIFSGGGILIPGMQDALERAGIKFTVAKDPEFANARGMAIYAQKQELEQKNV